MSYQQYMNMGFGAAGAGHPYMMGFQGGMPMQMQPNPQQYLQNHRPQAVGHTSVPSQPAPNKGGKRKLANDPNRPKRPTSAYFYFVQIEREEAKRGEKITRVAQWTKEISVKWRELTVTEKEQFQIMAANDKARYTQQMAVYTGKDANRPKRPQSAYFLWLADFRARMKDKFIENKDILRAAGEEWRKMTTMSKAPYEQLAEEERRKYEVKMKEYNMNGGPAAKRPCVDPTPLPLDVKSSSSSGASPGSASTAATPYNSQPPPPTLPPQQLASYLGHQMGSRAQQSHEDDDDDDDIDDDEDDIDDEDGEDE